MIELQGRKLSKVVQSETGLSILELARKNDVDWGFMCTRGTCARCRCYIVEGMPLLSQPNEAEWDRLEPEEIERGYRLGCQVRIQQNGKVKVIAKPYF